MPQQHVRRGGRVRVQRGVFEGVEGTIISYRSATRLLIAVELDCRGVSLEIDDRMVEVLDT
jgi:transcription antitermination factor NusG